MSTAVHIEGTWTDANGHPATGYIDAQVFALPTCTVMVVSPVGVIYSGDPVVVQVSGTTDADANPATSSLKVAGAAVAVSPDGLFRFTAA